MERRSDSQPDWWLEKQLCQDGDGSSLLQFKQTFVFDTFSCDPSTDNYTKLSSWKVGDDCCSWDGVDCDVQTGHVIGLNLSSSCLYGSINSDSPVFRLVHLTSLNLSSNNFNLSRIPGGIRSLSKLKHLDLAFANFSGQIPSEILELFQLVSLSLWQNPFMLQKPSLKELVEALTNLTELKLSGVNISSHVPQSLSNLTSLTTLLLKDCSLHGEFPGAIFKLPNLCIVSLRNNPDLTGYLPEFSVASPLEKLALDGTNMSGQLPFSISNLRSLSYFSASGCSFGGLIPSSIGNLTKLDHLELSDNYFSGNIPSSLGNLLQLTYLALTSNNFSPGTLDWLGKLTNLQILDLRNTNSYGAIPSSFRNLTQLVELWLTSNQLTGQIPSWLGNSTHLTKLVLSDNELQGLVPDSIFRLPYIQVVDLYSNNLSGSMRYDSFLQSKYLSILQLSANHLSFVDNTYSNVTLPKFEILSLAGCQLGEFPAFLRGQDKLEVLVLNQNNIKGYVPNWIFTLERLSLLNLAHNFLIGFEHYPSVTLPSTHLTVLGLSNNKLEGPLPIPPASLAVYDVSQNKLSGDVSPLFCNLTSAFALDFSGNNLSGNLPPCLGNLGSSASVLKLTNNNLSGKIPDNYASGCALMMMDFSQNNFEGELPRSLANCSNLEILNLEDNQMTDVFPSWLGILPHLRILSLRSNKFHGAIGQPLSKLQFNRLQIIDLSNNNFTGKLPLEYFRNWVAMKVIVNNRLAYMEAITNFQSSGGFYNFLFPYFIRIVNKGTQRSYNQILEFFVVVDLSSNKFEGEIPESLGTLRALQSLNLSNNILTGHIPLSLGNLKDLEALDFSLNELSGDIPIQLSVLTFLSVFNVSYNKLTGPVPRGNQFGTFQNDSFFANPGLCGMPLSKMCGDTGTLSLPPPKDEDVESPLEFNWEIVLIGIGSGLVIGVAFGCAMDTRKYEWLIKKKFSRGRRSYKN
ncbi:receptor-like protein 7 isoform X2 [Euphorbia lathyris]|uniref:receptor-like protein 7 isoform X2 n=1 Tax=Euphorbia lathyris TaxID=212925 RepID=UPI003313C331